MRQLSNTAAAKLAKIGRTETADTTDTLRDFLTRGKFEPFSPVIETFLHFGGYTLPFSPDGRFKIYRLKEAIKLMAKIGIRSSDPLLFRMPFGASETIQSFYWINGLGHLFEDEKKMVDGIVEWIEDWSRNPSMGQWR